MLAAVVYIPCFIAICLPYGWASIRALQRGGLRTDEELPGLPWLMIAGVIVLTWAASVLSLFLPLGPIAFALIAAGAVLLGVLALRTDRPALMRAAAIPPLRIPEILALTLMVVIVLYEALLPPSNPDTSIYHAQAIHWIESYPAVPGLGNLFGRLAYNSQWLVVIALFSLAFLKIQSFHLLPAAFLLAAGIYFLGGLQAWLRTGRGPANILKALLMPFVFYVLAAEISSPGTDLPATLLIWLTAALWMENDEATRTWEGTRRALLVLIPVFTVTVKISTAPLLLLGLVSLWPLIRARTYRYVITLSLLGAMLLLPWLARNVILSGYLVYPQTTVDIFQFDWKVPAELVKADQSGIIGFARLPGRNVGVSSALPLMRWFPIWLAALRPVQLAMFLAAALAPLLLGAVLFIRGRREMDHTIILVATSYLGLLFWLNTAPDLRFGFGFMAVLALAPLAALIDRLPAGTRSPAWPALFFLGILLLYQAYFAWKIIDPGGVRQYAVLPAAYPHASTMACRISNTALFVAQTGRQCGYKDFPCAPFCRPELELRGPDWGDGFRLAAPVAAP